jgi:5-methylcytosine-specific restriction protein A
MPTAPKHPCAHPGCRALVERGKSRCEQHTQALKRSLDNARPSSRERGYDARWEKARKSYLHSHPYCASCLETGVPTLATVIDHIVPHKGDQRLFWDETNWQGLCQRCHNRKTARFDGGWGR